MSRISWTMELNPRETLGQDAMSSKVDSVEYVSSRTFEVDFQDATERDVSTQFHRYAYYYQLFLIRHRGGKTSKDQEAVNIESDKVRFHNLHYQVTTTGIFIAFPEEFVRLVTNGKQYKKTFPHGDVHWPIVETLNPPEGHLFVEISERYPELEGPYGRMEYTGTMDAIFRFGVAVYDETSKPNLVKFSGFNPKTSDEGWYDQEEVKRDLRSVFDKIKEYNTMKSKQQNVADSGAGVSDVRDFAV
ncbi:hypothetical protein NHQ30_006563 [Ciborinia camelliae]|nr:hypothetical protein NHQ30_006563 [Ciborinia camelliae]